MTIRLNSLLLTLLFITSQSLSAFEYTSYYEPNNRSSLENTVLGTALIGGALGIGYGIYKLVQKIFTKSDEQIYQEVKHNFENTKRTYQFLYHIVVPEIWRNDCPNYADYLFSNEVAAHIGIKNTATGFLSTFKSRLDSLIKDMNNLEERMHSSKKMRYSLKNDMTTLRNQIDQLHHNLTRHYNLLYHYKNYINAYLTLKLLNETYKKEFSYLDSHDYQLNAIQSMTFLRGCIMVSGKRYPYIAYAQDLAEDIEKLESNIQALTRQDYQLIHQDIERVRSYLTILQPAILAQPEYHDELKERERNRLIEEQLALERRKIEAQEAQARAQRSQAWAQQDMANAQRAQAFAQQNLAYEQHEHNRLKRLELLN